MNDLHKQLIRLGDMMGDGLHLEPDGKWIAQDYKRVAKALGYDVTPKRKNNGAAINAAMETHLKRFKCSVEGCDSTSAKQTRSGSLRFVCCECGTKYQAKKAPKSRK